MTAFIDLASKDPSIPALDKACACDKEGCPGPDKFEIAYGLAGGGMGPYAYCMVCDDIRGKDVDPEENADDAG